MDENPYRAPRTIPQEEQEEAVPKDNTPASEWVEILKVFLATVGTLLAGYGLYQIDRGSYLSFTFGLMGIVGLVVVAALVVRKLRS